MYNEAQVNRTKEVGNSFIIKDHVPTHIVLYAHCQGTEHDYEFKAIINFDYSTTSKAPSLYSAVVCTPYLAVHSGHAYRLQRLVRF